MSYSEVTKRGAKKTTQATTEISVQEMVQKDSETDHNHTEKKITRRFIRCKNRNAWKKTKKRGKQRGRGKKTLLNLSGWRLSDDNFVLLEKGLCFGPKGKCHDYFKLTEEFFK